MVCSVRELTLDRGVRAVRLENDLLAATVLVDKGADVYELIYKPKQMDVLWKSPWGLRRPAGGTFSATNTAAAWIEAYEGGWQEIFPSGGGPCTYKGVELNFHGEASTSAWDFQITEADGSAELALSLRLARSPFRIERIMGVEAGKPVLTFQERVTNDGGEPMDYMWGHHPAFGAPFLSGACRIDTNGVTLVADDAYAPPHTPVDLARSYQWPQGGTGETTIDLSRVPGLDEPRATLAYFTEYAGDHAWYGITNTELGFGVGLVWPTAAFPGAWFWQEMHASPGFPWYKGVYVMAIEPGTSWPGQGLVNVMEKTQTHRTLQPGESAEAELRAVFYESANGLAAIDADGTARVKE